MTCRTNQPAHLHCIVAQLGDRAVRTVDINGSLGNIYSRPRLRKCFIFRGSFAKDGVPVRHEVQGKQNSKVNKTDFAQSKGGKIFTCFKLSF